MAHTKAQKTAKGNKDSIAKRLGIKIYGNQKAINGNIIVRQRGSEFYPGVGTRSGRDYTIYAIHDGIVHFKTRRDKKYVEVKPLAGTAQKAAEHARRGEVRAPKN